jgi:class 3 adenylate cyclase/tetratricopeptide (TPR) repeat protein
MPSRRELEQAIAAIESQRNVLGDAVVDASIVALREKLAAMETPARQEQRKLVTVLFADLVGFTAMAERLDPEDVREIQQAYFAAVTPPIAQRGGQVEKYIGDAILAVFGIPRARESDPENAVHAALAMQQALDDLSAQLSGTYHHDFQQGTLRMRIGVATGSVVASMAGEIEIADRNSQQTWSGGDFVVTGDTVNLAARLQSAAPPGRVLISHDTYRHVRGLFDVESLHPLQVKGKAQPVQAYLALRARSRPFHTITRGVEGIETPLIGRESEMAVLQGARQSVAEARRLQMVTIVGDAGVGKSRLLFEFERWAAGSSIPWLTLRGRSSPETQATPFGLLRSVFVSHLRISDSDGGDEARWAVEAGIGEFLGSDSDAPMKAAFIGQVLGFDFAASPHLKDVLADPRQLRNRALRYIADFLRAAADQAPTCILLEDLHWADESSIEAIGLLASGAWGELPVLIVGLARPTLYERQPDWGADQPFHTRLDLQPLSKHASRQLVDEILCKVDSAPDALRELVVGAAEGNPFYVEELIKKLIEDGVIIVDDSGWRVEHGQLAQIQLPATLVAVLQARLDHLPREERTILQQASVVGRVFWDQTVMALNAGQLPVEPAELAISGATPGSDGLRSLLSTLRGRELVFQREVSAFSEAEEYLFKHALLREVTYESVLRRVRQRYHGLVADWLLQQGSARVNEFVGQVADHLALAGRNAEAISYLQRAGDLAAAQYANAEAIGFYRRALRLVENSEPSELEAVHRDGKARQLHEQLGDVLELTGQHDAALVSYECAVRLTPEWDRVTRARLHRKSGVIWQVQLQVEQALAAWDEADLALGQAPVAPDPQWWREWIQIRIDRALLYYYNLADAKEMARLSEEMRPALERYGTAGQRCMFFQRLVLMAFRQERFVISDETLAYAQMMLAASQEVDNAITRGFAQFVWAFCYLWRDDLDQAEEGLLTCLATAERSGDVTLQTRALTYLTLVQRKRGRVRETGELAARTLAVAKAGQMLEYIAQAQMHLAWIAWRQKDFAAAREIGQTALADLRQVLMSSPLHWLALGPLLGVALVQNQTADAVDCARQMLDPSQHKLPDNISAPLEQAVAAWKQGNPDEARRQLELAASIAAATGYL